MPSDRGGRIKVSPSTYRIVPAEGGRWMIVSDDNQTVLANQDYPTQDVALAAIDELARKGGRITEVERAPDGRLIGVKIVDSHRTLVPMTLIVSVEFRDFLDKIAAEMNVDRVEALRLALGLLRIGLDAKAEGKSLAIITSDYDIDQEITGF